MQQLPWERPILCSRSGVRQQLRIYQPSIIWEVTILSSNFCATSIPVLILRGKKGSTDNCKEAYQEFTKQLGSYDTRRQFWLNTDYYKQRLENDPKADAALLDELINDIEFTPADEVKI